MGKSAGKWIKTVLFGKKYSKSNFSKNVTPDKDTAAKTPVEEISQNPPVISDPYQSTEIGVETLELEKGAPGPHCDTIALSPLNQGLDSQSDDGSAPVSDGDMKRQEHAAAKAQAAFRGYLARRAFRALKGIIRLQALIRGHLVRRQAVATMRCMQAIVKVQALARGRKVDVVAASSFFGSEKLATNTFVRKLIVKMPTATPLRLQYDVAEPNSAWSWLERWSASHFWEPPARTKKATKSKPHRKQGSPSPQTVEPESGKSKRTIRKVPTAANGDNSTLASEMDKPKRNPGKLTSNQTEVAQEQAQSELERVKRNLRKVSSSSSVQAAEKSETEIEKPRSVEIAKASAPADVPDLEIAVSPENTEHSDGVADKPDFLETHLENELVDAPLDNHHPAVEMRSVENGVNMESVLNLDDELGFKEEEVSKENPKIRKRRSLPAKQQQEFSEKMSQNSPSLPSYMAATESAKAKLRGQGPLKHGEDGADIGNARRHSLPASTNGKLNSLSPRVQANAKGGSKANATLTSRDDKVVQPGWRR